MEDEILKNNFNVHDHLKDLPLTELVKLNNSDRSPYGVCILNITNSLNAGMIVRTACCLGAEKVIVFGRRKYDKRSCVGSHNYITVDRVDGVEAEYFSEETATISVEKFDAVMKENNYYPVFLETGGNELSTSMVKTLIEDMAYYNPTLLPCLIFGNEGIGIPKNLIRNNPILTIPMLGVIRSLNVSAAATIAMWEFNNVFTKMY